MHLGLLRCPLSQFSGDYGLAQVQRLVRRLKGLSRTKGPQTFLTEQEQQESQPGCLVIPESQLHKWLEEVFRAMYAEAGQVRWSLPCDLRWV
jgi:hypothetical protein